MKTVEFNGSLKTFHEVCQLLGNDMKEHFYDWKQLEGGNELDVTIGSDTYRLLRGDSVKLDGGVFSIVRKERNDQ